MVPPVMSNATARRIFLERHALCGRGTTTEAARNPLELIRRLGFVQLDSINTVARAHDMILHTRLPGYRPRMLERLLARDRAVFEHWTHDAAVIPMEYYPHWHLRFARDRARLGRKWPDWRPEGFQNRFEEVLAQVAKEGPVCSSDVGQNETRQSGWWNWHPSKTALEFLWRCGELAVTHRSGFQKYYDLANRVIPQDIRDTQSPSDDSIDWLCGEAARRLGFFSSGELAAFWDIVTPLEARDWCKTQLEAGKLIEIEVESANRSLRRCFALPDVLAQSETVSEPPGQVRLLSPFDPAIRDRKRTERLFGFRYRIEVFVPAAQRQYGYYVFPLLEGANLIGRVDAKAFRAEKELRVRGLWLEDGVKAGKGRMDRIARALQRVARFADCDHVVYLDGWARGATG